MSTIRRWRLQHSNNLWGRLRAADWCMSLQKTLMFNSPRPYLAVLFKLACEKLVFSTDGDGFQGANYSRIAWKLSCHPARLNCPFKIGNVCAYLRCAHHFHREGLACPLCNFTRGYASAMLILRCSMVQRPPRSCLWNIQTVPVSYSWAVPWWKSSVVDIHGLGIMPSLPLPTISTNNICAVQTFVPAGMLSSRPVSSFTSPHSFSQCLFVDSLGLGYSHLALLFYTIWLHGNHPFI